MEDWRPTSPLMNRRWLNFAQSAPTELPAPVSPTGEPSVTPPAWLEGAQWQATPETTSWPEPPPTLPSTLTDDPFERAAIRRTRSQPRRGMRTPFLDEPPQDYPSHLAPVPRAPDWEQVIPGPSPWSPLAPPPRATDWGKTLSGIECRRTGDGNYVNCTTPGGIRATVPAEKFPDYIGPGHPSYHYYNTPVRGPHIDPSQLMQGVIDRPTPGPRSMVRPATAEGTINEATPEWAYNATIAQARELPGTPVNSVKSYITHDQMGRPVMVNVTRPQHQLAPGVVMRYVTTGPSGSTIQNEGAGLGVWQAPRGWPAVFGIPDNINDVWNEQSRAIINEQLRRLRR